jgi:hypothetical protein
VPARAPPVPTADRQGRTPVDLTMNSTRGLAIILGTPSDPVITPRIR